VNIIESKYYTPVINDYVPQLIDAMWDKAVELAKTRNLP
jgi:hypothetical protein